MNIWLPRSLTVRQRYCSITYPCSPNFLCGVSSRYYKFQLEVHHHPSSSWPLLSGRKKEISRDADQLLCFCLSPPCNTGKISSLSLAICVLLCLLSVIHPWSSGCYFKPMSKTKKQAHEILAQVAGSGHLQIGTIVLEEGRFNSLPLPLLQWGSFPL